MKKIIALVLAVAMLCSVTVFAHPFKDVTGHWSETEIEEAYNGGSINGDPDGKFRPDDKISRGEFVKMLTAAMCEKVGAVIPDEFDDGTHWAAKYYNFATNTIFIPLDESSNVGEITPGLMSAANFDMPISRWEMAYIVSEGIGNVLGIIGQPQELTYNDKAEIEQTYPTAIATAIDNAFLLHIMTGDENGNIEAGNGGTRAEAVVIVNRVSRLMQEVIDYTNKMYEEYEKQMSSNVKTYEEIPTGHPVVTIQMEDGQKVLIELYPEYAPQTVANFVELVKNGFYDGLTFHRIVAGFMAQGGDPDGNGSGGSANTIVGEFASNGFAQNTLKHTRGVISMARADHPNSASSQFFICYDDAAFLDGNYAAFGKVITGMNVIDSFLEKELDYNQSGELATPVEPIVMKKVTVNLGKK
jgi:peptidylprolyl isomerase/peptidyl-prolyl cis-trans isomerase B (cyclophilin B)